MSTITPSEVLVISARNHSHALILAPLALDLLPAEPSSRQESEGPSEKSSGLLIAQMFCIQMHLVLNSDFAPF